jgi:hypothetical protein
VFVVSPTGAQAVVQLAEEYVERIPVGFLAGCARPIGSSLIRPLATTRTSTSMTTS